MSSEEDMHAAARAGDLVKVQSILRSNPMAVNARDKHSRTPLHLAAWAGHEQVVSYLCKHKADVRAAAVDDMGAIHFAAQRGHSEVVRILLTSGVSVKACTRKGFTPLHYAVQGSNLDLVNLILKKGASVSARTKAGKTPLDLARTDEIRSLLKDGRQSSEKKHSDDAEKHDESVPELVRDDQEPTSAEDGGGVENTKRKDDERDKAEAEASPKPKKAKVALKHLLSADDTQEDEEL